MQKQYYERNKDPNFWAAKNNECNCGSFALNVTSWFSPYDNDEEYTEIDRTQWMKDLCQAGKSKNEIEYLILERDAQEILKICPWIERVDYSEVTPDERLIAYRLKIEASDFLGTILDEDFHFRVRIGGFWFEKCGSYDVKLCDNQDIFADWESTTDLIYDSSIAFFRYREKN